MSEPNMGDVCVLTAPDGPPLFAMFLYQPRQGGSRFGAFLVLGCTTGSLVGTVKVCPLANGRFKRDYAAVTLVLHNGTVLPALPVQREYAGLHPFPKPSGGLLGVRTLTVATVSELQSLYSSLLDVNTATDLTCPISLGPLDNPVLVFDAATDLQFVASFQSLVGMVKAKVCPTLCGNTCDHWSIANLNSHLSNATNISHPMMRPDDGRMPNPVAVDAPRMVQNACDDMNGIAETPDKREAARAYGFKYAALVHQAREARTSRGKRPAQSGGVAQSGGIVSSDDDEDTDDWAASSAPRVVRPRVARPDSGGPAEGGN